jgi:hypothetical protein
MIKLARFGQSIYSHCFLLLLFTCGTLALPATAGEFQKQAETSVVLTKNSVYVEIIAFAM